MMIKSLHLSNFKNYKGEHSLNFNTIENDKEKNIILIGGLNGAGKTSILEAVKLCLYGKKLNGEFIGEKDYKDLILSKINSSILNNDEAKCSIQLDIKLDGDNGFSDLSIIREWNVEEKKNLSENFKLLYNNKELEIVPKEMWEDYVSLLIPTHIADFFFFDGKRIKTIASEKNSEEILRETVYGILNLRKYEALEKDLITLIKNIRQKNVQDEKINNILKEKQTLLNSIEDKLKEISMEFQKKTNELEIVRKKMINLEKDIRRKAGELATKKDEYQRRIVNLERDIEQKDEEIKKLSEESIPFLMASKICKELIEQLKIESRIKEKEIANKIIKEVERPFIKEFSNSNKIKKKLKKTEIKLLRKEAERIFSWILKGEKYSSTKTFHELSDSQSNKIQNFLKGIDYGLKSRVNEILEKREEERIELQKLNLKIKKIPNGTVDSEINSLVRLRSKINSLESEIPLLTEKKKEMEVEREKILKEIEKLEEQIVCNEIDRKKIEICRNIISSLTDFKEFLISIKMEELEKKISDMYRFLANKGENISGIKVNSQTFSVDVIDKSGNTINKENMSAGEKEIYAISILWGLSEMSGYKMPMIIDTPLAELDNKHVSKITQRFFPSASHQLILLSQDREIDEKVYESLKKNIIRSYLLELSEENKIKEGYFYV